MPGSTSATATRSTVGPVGTHRLPVRLVSALLALAVAAIHVVDQGGFPGSKTPGYIGIGYYVLEASAVLVAVRLLTPRRYRPVRTWLLAAAVGAGPILGYVLSRGPGLPDYTDDKGNWTEPLGVVSLLVEAVLLLISVRAFTRRPVGHTVRRASEEQLITSRSAPPMVAGS